MVTTSITQEIVAHLHRCKSRCQRQNRSQTRRRRETTASLIVRAAKQPAMPITVCSPCVYTVHSIQWRIPGGGGGSLGSHESPPRPRASHHCIELPSITLKAKFHYAIKVADQVADLDADLRVRVAGLSKASCANWSATRFELPGHIEIARTCSLRPAFDTKEGRELVADTHEPARTCRKPGRKHKPGSATLIA